MSKLGRTFNKLFRFYRHEYCVVIALFFFVQYQLYTSNSTFQLWKNHRMYMEYGERVVNTAKGWIPYRELDAQVFKPQGYRIAENTIPIPTLEYLQQPTCSKVFSDWLVASTSSASLKYQGPHQSIPEHVERQLLMNGHARISYAFENHHYASEAQTWDTVEKWAELDENNLAEISNYGQTGMSVYYALQSFPIRNFSGLVIGSTTPWVEAYALKQGARKILTLEYQELNIVGTSRLSYEHPVRFAQQWKRHHEVYDFAISFSSIEHSGLGRYGDVMDPIGDLREVQKVACSLKKGGLFFLGLPRGQDALKYNLHRVYGRIRLGMIMTVFEWLASFRGDSAHPMTSSIDDFDGMDNAGGYYQDLFVLRKL